MNVVTDKKAAGSGAQRFTTTPKLGVTIKGE